MMSAVVDSALAIVEKYEEHPGESIPRAGIVGRVPCYFAFITSFNLTASATAINLAYRNMSVDYQQCFYRAFFLRKNGIDISQPFN